MNIIIQDVTPCSDPLFRALRLSPEVLAFFRKQGRGWQTRVDKVLSRYVKRKAA